MGPVKHLVMFDAEHGMYTESYHKGELLFYWLLKEIQID